MFDSDVYPASASSIESCITSNLRCNEEIELASTVETYDGQPSESNEDFDQDWPRRFLVCSVHVKIVTKTPMTECLCLFSVAKSMLRMGSCVRFCRHNILLLLIKSGEGSPCLAFVWANKKPTFESNIERICYITKRDDLSPRSHLPVLLQVAPFIWDCRQRLWSSNRANGKRVSL